MQRVPGQCELHSETLAWNDNNKNKFWFGLISRGLGMAKSGSAPRCDHSIIQCYLSQLCKEGSINLTWYNPSNLEAHIRGSQIQGQPGLPNKTLSQETKEEEERGGGGGKEG
jgi:hypothetical protein